MYLQICRMVICQMSVPQFNSNTDRQTEFHELSFENGVNQGSTFLLICDRGHLFIIFKMLELLNAKNSMKAVIISNNFHLVSQ